jgi:uncharacterized protein (DUF2141 family)
MSDYRIEAATKEEWAERALRAEANAMKASNAALLEKRRADEAEAKLAIATEGLRQSEGEIDNYIRWEYPSDHPVHEQYRKRDFAANPARITLAELKGETDD